MKNYVVEGRSSSGKRKFKIVYANSKDEALTMLENSFPKKWEKISYSADSNDDYKYVDENGFFDKEKADIERQRIKESSNLLSRGTGSTSTSNT